MSNNSEHWAVIRNCFHFNPPDAPDKHVERFMSDKAKEQRRFDVAWGVVHPGNALCHSIHRTFREAHETRRKEASAYAVVRVVITPLYTQTTDESIVALNLQSESERESKEGIVK